MRLHTARRCLPSERVVMKQQLGTVARTSSGLDRLVSIARDLSFEPCCDSFAFVRHGQTARNARAIFQGLDEPLDGTGEAQALECCAVLAQRQIGAIVCSDMLRARQTALAVARPHALVPLQDAGLRERNFGELIGTSSLHIDWACAPRGGETLEAFVLRTRDAMLWALNRPGPVLIVAHGGILLVLAALLRLELAPLLLANASPLCLDRVGTNWRIQALVAGSAGSANLA